MKSLNYTSVPASRAEDINAANSRWLDGKIVSLESRNDITFYIAHRDITTMVQDSPDSEPHEAAAVEAFAFTVKKPVSRDAAINAAEMEAYNLTSAMAVASFNASLARKHRENPDDAEVAEHDEFIALVKSELSKIGI
jgi:hypothetical protein